MIVRIWVAVAALAAATGAGAIAGTTMLATANAASVNTSTTSPAATTRGAPGAAHGNEDPTHEAGESAAREAAEDNGTAVYGPPAGSTGAPTSGTTAN